ncbi:AMP-binding protein [Pseudomonas sp.]|uniref:AMP-binding protein n=1 Tax=Pseudomonas sp. TaxID=306 RepID=UPI003D0F7753
MLSHVVGPTTEPLLDFTIGEALQRAARQWGDRPALIDRGQHVRLTWRELEQRAAHLALGLNALGLQRGERIGIWSLNRYEWTITQYAAARLGLILVTINPAYRAAELEYVLANAGCAALVLAPGFKSSDYIGMVRALLPEMEVAVSGRIQSSRLPELRHVIQLGDDPANGALAFAAVERRGAGLESAMLDEIAAQINVHDPACIQFTSGTTGSPKGVTLSHHNILNNAYFNGKILGFTADDRVCLPLPLYHCFALTLGVLTCLAFGGSIVYPGEGFDPAATLRAVDAERCTMLYGVPTMFIAQLEHPDFDTFDLSSLHGGIMGGSPCPLEVMRKVVDRMNMRDVTIAYGMTETSPVNFQSATTDPLERRVSTVGRVHPHAEAKIVDAQGNTVQRGSSGEICIRGYLVMLGYWQAPEQTALAVDEDGWMHTGDLGILDDEGYCNIVGRLKDMVIRGGENLYPREIEEFLYRHPAIRDVQVFGVPDNRFGEELCAWIVLKTGATLDETGLRAFCAGQIAHYKVPRYIRFVDDYPMTVTGKAQKFLMRELMQEELGLVAGLTA